MQISAAIEPVQPLDQITDMAQREAMRQDSANRMRHTLAATGQQATEHGLTEDALNRLLADES